MINVIDYLSKLPTFLLFLLLNFIFIAISISSVCVIKLFVPLDIRRHDNSVIGNTSNLISLIYGVLAGIAALYLINNNSYTAEAVQREANAVADIYRDSRWLQEPTRTKIQDAIKSYLIRVVNVEWPLMKAGKNLDPSINIYIDEITNALIEDKETRANESLLMHDMFDDVRILYDARHQRIHMSYSKLNSELWVVILIGTLLTLCINFIFGMNFYLHIVTVTAAAIMTSSMIFLLMTLDRPFQGEFAIEPSAFQAVLTSMQK